MIARLDSLCVISITFWDVKVICLTVYTGGSVVKNPPASAGDTVQSLVQEGPLEKEMATCSSILAWRTPWTEKPGGLQSMALQSLHDLATEQQQPQTTTLLLQNNQLHSIFLFRVYSLQSKIFCKKWAHLDQFKKFTELDSIVVLLM